MNDIKAWFRFRALQRNLRLPRDELRRLQEHKLRRLAAHAYARVPYYRRLFDHSGVKPEQIQTLDDLRRIPPIHKADLRAVPQSERVADGVDVDRLICRLSNGSTSEPMSILLSPDQLHLQNVLHFRSMFEVGLRWQDRGLTVDQHHGAVQRWHHRLGLMRWQNTPLFQTPEMLAAVLRTYRPDIAEFYPQYLRLAAYQTMTDGGERVPIRAVFSYAEPLTEGTRAMLSDAFNTVVFDRYGTTEAFTVAWECRAHRGYHTDADHVIVECLQEGEPTNDAGEVFITNLDAYAMPLIRYSLEDVATLTDEMCPCGCAFPMIHEIRGRLIDVFTLANGQPVHGNGLGRLIDRLGDVVAFRIIQKKPGHLRYEVIPAVDFRREAIAGLTKLIAEMCHGQMEAEVRLVESLPVTPGGKRHVYVSEVRPLSGYAEP